MPEVEFTIDTSTGELHMHVRDVAGPACDDVARLVKQLAGEPGREEATANTTYARGSTRGRRRGSSQSAFSWCPK